MDQVVFAKKEARLSLIILLIFTVLSMSSISCKKTHTSPGIEILNLPVIWLNTYEISFTASEIGSNPSSGILMVKNSGHKTLNYTISVDADWVSVKPNRGL